MYISPIGPNDLKRGEMKSDNPYRNNRSDTTYRIHLVKSFRDVSGNAGHGDTPAPRGKYDPFHSRVTPIETFVNRVAALVHPLNDSATITSERSGLSGKVLEKTLTIRLDHQTFKIHDRWEAVYPTANSMHEENCAFLESAGAGVAAFSKAVAERWPSLSDDIETLLGKLENRLRSNCHDNLRRARLKEKFTAMRNARDTRRAGGARNLLSVVSNEPA